MSKRRCTIFIDRAGVAHVVDQDRLRYVKMCKAVHAWADSVPEDAKNRLVHVTLTYKDTPDWAPGHIRQFLLLLKAEFKNDLKAYAWVLELQERGTPHYHVMVVVDEDTWFPHPDEGIQREGYHVDLWPWGRSHLTFDIKSPFYLLGYTKKKRQKNFQRYPKGARLFGLYIRDRTATQKMRYIRLPEYLRNEVDYGGGWAWLPIARKEHVAESELFYKGTYTRETALGLANLNNLIVLPVVNVSG